MTKMIRTIMLLLVGVYSYAQTPVESPRASATAKIGNATITIDYGQPSVKGRKIFGNLVPFGEVWRTGANETTAIEFSNDVTFEGKKVRKGKYALFTIPGENEWVIILNRTIKWGAFSYKQEEDVLRVTVPSKASGSFYEKMTFKVNSKGLVTLNWENTEVTITIR